MLAPNPKLSAEERRAERHRANVAECAPFLDPSIPLGTVLMSEADTRAIRRYYARKHARGEYGQYFLHQVGAWKSGMHDQRRGNGRD